MDYPTYNKQSVKISIKKIACLGLVITLLSFFIQGLVYVLAPLLFVIMTYSMFKGFKGFKALSGLFLSLMVMLLLIDMGDGLISWSINHVLPSFMIGLICLQTLLFLFWKKAWLYHYTIHIILTLVSLGLLLATLVGLVSSVVSIVAMSFGLMAVLLAWLLKGHQYWKSYVKYCHI